MPIISYEVIEGSQKGRMVELAIEKWCSCIDGALTKENYLGSIRKAGFNNPDVLQETIYLEDKTDGRIITSLVVKATK